jgi:hypothetical protein
MVLAKPFYERSIDYRFRVIFYLYQDISFQLHISLAQMG